MSERIFKMYSPLTGELYQAGEYEYEDSVDEYNGEELLLYAKEIDKAVKAYTDNGTEDLMKYFYESEYVKQHVRSLVPSVEVWNGRLYGCTTVRADEDLSEPGWDKLMDYLSGSIRTAGARALSSGKSKPKMACFMCISGRTTTSTSRWRKSRLRRSMRSPTSNIPKTPACTASVPFGG